MAEAATAVGGWAAVMEAVGKVEVVMAVGLVAAMAAVVRAEVVTAEADPAEAV